MTAPKIILSAMRWIIILLLVLMVLVFVPAVAAQAAGEDTVSESAVCTFQDGKQVSVRYKRLAGNGREPIRPGKLWGPGGSPAFLFTEAELQIGNSSVAPGAYSIYLIPGKDEWTLLVNSNVSSDARYDEKQNILRVRMDTGELTERVERVTIYFGMIGPRECDMRLDYGKTRAWIEFKEK